MSSIRALASSFVILLAARAAFALTPVPAAADPRPIDQLTPANTHTSVFVSVKRAFQLYGTVITASPRYKEMQALIAQGFPDPATDLDEIGVASDLSDRENPSVGAVVTGRINKDKALACAAAHNVTFATSVYRGIVLLSAKINYRQAQIAFFDERITVVAVDQKGTHPIMKTILDNLLAQTEAHATGLTAGYLVQGTQDTRPITSGMPETSTWGVLKHITGLNVDAQPREATLDVGLKIIILTDNAQIAAMLGQQLQQAANEQHTHIADPHVNVDGTNINFDCTVLKHTIEDYLGH